MLLFTTILLLFQNETKPSETAPLVSIWSILVFAGGIILNLGGALVLLKSATVKENLKQTQDLAKVYKENWEKEKVEREKLEKKHEIALEHCETFERSYNALAGIAIRELLHFDELIQERDALERRCKKLEDENLEHRMNKQK